MGKILSIPVGSVFIKNAVNEILKLSLSKKSGLLSTIIIVPTERIKKNVVNELMNVRNGKNIILPYIISINNISEDTPYPLNNFLEKDIALAGSNYKLFWFAKEIEDFYKNINQEIDLKKSISYATELIKLFNKFTQNNIKLDSIDILNNQDHSVHWQKLKVFIKFINDAWTDHLIEKKIIDENLNNIKNIKQLGKNIIYLNEFYSKNNFDIHNEFNIFSFGLTSINPIIQDFNSCIYSYKKGYIILSGYNSNLNDYQKISIMKNESHPLHSSIVGLNKIGLDNIKNKKFTNLNIKNICNFNVSREHFILSSFLPAKETINWTNLNLDKTFLDSVNFHQLESLEEEALTISLIIKNIITLKRKETCALVTADRNLSRMVMSNLRGWGIEADDSSGIPLSKSLPSIFIFLILDVVINNFSQASLISLFKNPLTKLNFEEDLYLRISRIIERNFLRGQNITKGLDSLKEIIENIFEKENIKEKKDILVFIDNLKKSFSLFNKIFLDSKKNTVSKIVDAHIDSVISLSKNENGQTIFSIDENDTSSQINKDALDVLKALNEVKKNGEFLGKISIIEYFDILSTVINNYSKREAIGKHPRVFIWGLLEARLMHVDNLIIGSMNEGTFPALNSIQPWLSKSMKKEINLPSEEHSIGVSASDFISFLSSEKIHFTRSLKKNGQETIASRWWSRMETLLNANGTTIDDCSNFLFENIASNLYLPKDQIKLNSPSPKPKNNIRPKTLSISDIEILFNDPYQIFAKKILNLYPEKEILKETSNADKGIILHNSLELFTKKYESNNFKSKEEVYNCLLKCGSHIFKQHSNNLEVQNVWLPNYIASCNKISEYIYNNQYFIKEVYSEKKCFAKFYTDKNNFLIIVGRADRIEIDNDNNITISDYKTGTLPSKKSIKDLKKPQIILEALIASKNGFKDLNTSGKDIKNVGIWGVNPKFTEPMLLKGNNPKDVEMITDLIIDLEQKLKNTIDYYSLEKNSYLCSKEMDEYSNYNHLSRLDEWNVQDDIIDRTEKQ